MTTEPVAFFERPYPSANTILLRGEKPLLVDTGFGSDVAELERWLSAQGVAPADLAKIVNTHHHTDHVGGNHVLQRTYGLPIAAEASEAQAVNRRDPAACLAHWLAQPIEAFQVTQLLKDGDVLSTGDEDWQVQHTPGHSAGHIALYQPERRVALTGDALLLGDVGWLNYPLFGPQAAQLALESLERFAALDLRLAYPGHGPVITDVPAAIASSRGRLEKLQADPVKIGWHASKRIFAFALMIEGQMTEEGLLAYLLASPWFVAHAREVFQVTPEEFFPLLIGEMLRSGAASWQGGKLCVNGPHRLPAQGWAKSPTRVTDWD